MVDYIESDRGGTYTLICMAATFGIVCGCFIIPGLILSMYAAQVVYMAVSFAFAEAFALCIGLSVYYAGIFLVCVIAPTVYNVLFDTVTSGIDAICYGYLSVKQFALGW